MKIITIDKYNEDTGCGSYKIIVETNNGSRNDISFYDGEPEDNTLGRNFNDVYSIPDLLKIAYEAGKNGEEWELDGEI